MLNADEDASPSSSSSSARAANEPEEDEETEDDEPKIEQLALPAAWRNAGLWVDLELERQGLVEGSSADELQSPWDSEGFPHPDSGVLYPHAAINEHRSRPFVVPRGESLPDAAAKECLEATRERLASLWRVSSSHGISWDEMDKAFVSFSKAGKKRYDEWSRRQGDNPPEAATIKKRCFERAAAKVGRFCPEDAATGKPRDPMELYPSRVKRLASRYYVHQKRSRLDPWKPGRLTAHLQQLVVARMLRRETGERTYAFRRSASGVAKK